MLAVGTTDSGCSGVFGHRQIVYSAAILVFTLAKFMVPIWTLLCVLRPPEDLARPAEVTLANSYNMVSGNPSQDPRYVFLKPFPVFSLRFICGIPLLVLQGKALLYFVSLFHRKKWPFLRQRQTSHRR